MNSRNAGRGSALVFALAGVAACRRRCTSALRQYAPKRHGFALFAHFPSCWAAHCARFRPERRSGNRERGRGATVFWKKGHASGLGPSIPGPENTEFNTCWLASRKRIWRVHILHRPRSHINRLLARTTPNPESSSNWPSRTETCAISSSDRSPGPC